MEFKNAEDVQLPKRSDPSYRRLYYIKNREKARVQRRELYLRKRDFILHQNAEYNRSHPDIVRKAQREWRRRNAKKVADNYRKFAARNPGRVLAYARRRQALKKAASVNPAGISEWMQSVRAKRWAKCYYCGKRIPSTSVHFDHIIPLSKGGAHSVQNLCLSCPTCNLSKGAKPVRLWIEMGQQFMEV